MNARDIIKGRQNELSVREVVFPRRSDEGSTSSDFLGDLNEVTAFQKDQVTIRDQEVKHVVRLKEIEKKPLEDYYGGKKGKKDCRKKVRPKKAVFNLSDLAQSVQQMEANDNRLPGAGADSSKDSSEEEEEIRKRQLQYKIYNDLKMREIEDRKYRMQQREAEANCMEELENLAETWLEYRKRRNQLKQSLDSFRERPCTFHRMGCSLISRKYWSDDGDEVSPRGEGKRTSLQTREKHKEVKKESENTRRQSNTEELGEEPLEKLEFVYDEESTKINSTE